MRDYERKLSFLSACLACTHAHIEENGASEAGGRRMRAKKIRDEERKSCFVRYVDAHSGDWIAAGQNRQLPCPYFLFSCVCARVIASFP